MEICHCIERYGGVLYATCLKCIQIQNIKLQFYEKWFMKMDAYVLTLSKRKSIIYMGNIKYRIWNFVLIIGSTICQKKG